jgi:hypothetical protein
VGEDLVKPPRRVDASEAAAENQNAVCFHARSAASPFSSENEVPK